MTINNLLPKFYIETLKTKFFGSKYWILIIIIGLLQKYKIATVEELANKFTVKILFESRRKKIQRFLSLPDLNFRNVWFPILEIWLGLNFKPLDVVDLAIDRTQWTGVNLMIVSLIYQKRAIPIYGKLLGKKGSSNLDEQKTILSEILPLFSNYKKIILGDREFCSVGLAKWLREKPDTYYCLRLRRNEYIEIKQDIWIQLKDLAPKSGVNFYKEKNRQIRRHSHFYISLHGKDWIESLTFFEKVAECLTALTPHKNPDYQRGHKAVTLIKSAL